MSILDKKYTVPIITVTVLVVLVVLWFLDYQSESIFLALLSLAIWVIKHIIDRSEKETDRKIEKQNQFIFQKSQGGIEFKKTILEEMYNVTMELWKQSVWLGSNWNALWPGNDDNVEKKKEFKDKFYRYKEYLQTYSINIPARINDLCKKLIYGIVMYEVGRDRKEGNWGGEITDEDKIKGGSDMSTGADMVKDAISELFSTIREEFGISDLTEELLDIKQPE